MIFEKDVYKVKKGQKATFNEQFIQDKEFYMFSVEKENKNWSFKPV